MPDQRVQYLLDRYLKNEATSAEEIELASHVQLSDSENQLGEYLEQSWQSFEAGEILNQDSARRILQHIVDPRKKNTGTDRSLPVAILRRWWAAAAILLCVATGAYIWLNRKMVSPEAPPQTIVANEIVPGKKGAILTLADGTAVMLDSLGNGIVTTQGGAQVLLEDGLLAYSSGEHGKKAGERKVFYNTMTTPRGREFQLSLPDGTRVWLNAASSIKYPTEFTGDKREVEITGEVYFEVVHQAGKPFRVQYAQSSGPGAERGSVEVLGTHFNIKAYPDEPGVETTLLEGRVRVTGGGQSAEIEPGEQVFAISHLSVNPVNAKESMQVRAADIQEVMAWKNGRFEFSGNIRGIMRQLARWYDVEVRYEGDVTDKAFEGAISKMEDVSQVLKMLELTESIHFKIEGKTIIVSR